jgi:hypothetical protein
LIGFPIRGVVMVYPRPTPQFWSLSALWSGWLWGQEAAAPLRGILSSRDLDWPWMTHATQITLEDLNDVLSEEIPVLGFMPDAEISSLLSWTSGSLAAGLQCNGLALEPDLHQGQSAWTINPSRSDPADIINHRVLIRRAGLDALQKAGEPKHTLALYSAAMANLARAGFPEPDSPMTDAGGYYEQLLKDFEENIAYRQGFLHYPQINSWWHQELDLVPLTQSDQVEIQLVRALLEGNGQTLESDLYQEIYTAFPGADTPRAGLIEACLTSYAERITGQPAAWKLNPNDYPSNRHNDMEEMEEILTSIGSALGYQTHTEDAPGNLSLVIWEAGGAEGERFYISASGLLNKIVTLGETDREQGWMILPGSRASLIHYKIRQNPLLAEVIQENWQLVKYRHLRRLHEQGGLTRSNFQERFCLDPFTSDSPQLPLI